jgi:hypothetical protein
VELDRKWNAKLKNSMGAGQGKSREWAIVVETKVLL